MHFPECKTVVLISHFTEGCCYGQIDDTITLIQVIFWRRTSLRWRHNGRDGDSNHQPHDYLLNRLLRRRSKKTSKLRVTGLCAGNSPHKGTVTRKVFPFDDVIMMRRNITISSYCRIYASVNRVSIGSDNGLSSIRRQAIILNQRLVIVNWTLISKLFVHLRMMILFIDATCGHWAIIREANTEPFSLHWLNMGALSTRNTGKKAVCSTNLSVSQRIKHESFVLISIGVRNPRVIGGLPQQRASDWFCVSMSW